MNTIQMDKQTEIKINKLLAKLQIDINQWDKDAVTSAFLKRMEEGLLENNAQLKMLPTYINPGPVPLDREVLVIDAGGTNLRKALISFNKNSEMNIKDFSKQEIPGLSREVNAEEFIKQFAKDLPLPQEENYSIGFCFSYPAETTPEKDGRVISMTKGVCVPDLEGKLIGAELKKEMQKQGLRLPREITVLNDTTAALLTGEMAGCGEEFSSFIGFILGTGMNCAYIEKNSNIEKLKGKVDSSAIQIINIEAGNFSDFPVSFLDQKLDKETTNKGLQKLEKACSGAYLGKLLLYLLQEAAEMAFFSSKLTEELLKLQSLETKDINLILNREEIPGCSFISVEEWEIILGLANTLLERASFLAAVPVFAALKKGAQSNPQGDKICINLEGTTILRLQSYKERFCRQLENLAAENNLPEYTIVSLENAPLIGAAIAGLCG